MIRYALSCDEGHAFESWFANSATYDRQVKRGLVGCPAHLRFGESERSLARSAHSREVFAMSSASMIKRPTSAEVALWAKALTILSSRFIFLLHLLVFVALAGA
jgi:hypothetical protein